MRVLGVDPGTLESHMVWYDGFGKVEQVWSGPNDDALYLLRRLRDAVTSSGGRYLQIAIESMDPRGMRLGRETLETLIWIGRFQEASGGVLVPRSEVKLHLCGATKADDAAIRTVLIDRLGKPGTKKSPGPTFGCAGHLWQALAVAVTYADKNHVVYNPTLDVEEEKENA